MPFRSRDSSANSQNNEGGERTDQEIPPLIDDGPETENKELMMKHPLGRIVLNIAATSNELARKGKHYGNILNLNNICDQFVNSMQLDSQRLSEHIDKNTEKISSLQPDIEKALLHKELDFVHLNQSITPPTFASENTGKLQEASKVFPVKHKFNGTNRSILEFLQDINFCQETCKLSEKEFLEMLLRCTTQKCYNILIQYMAIGFTTDDIYLSLLLLFDNRSTPTDCRKQLAQLTAPKSMTIVELQNKIMYLAGRCASDLPPGEARQSVYNLEACRALMSSLPSQSSHLVTSKYNILTAKLTAAPTFVQLLKIIAPHQNLINEDIRNNGTATNYAKHYNNKHTSFENKRNKVFKLSVSEENSANENNSNNTQRRYIRKFGTNNDSMEKKGNFQKHRYERESNIKKGCSLCGGTNHTAAQICYKMRTDNNQVVEVVPTYTPCPTCEDKLGKKLYHPSKFCISRANYPKFTRGREEMRRRQ